MKILICFGTRPEAIKMAPICLELKKRKIPYKLCVTAQHREMLDQVLGFFQLVPDYDLNLMKPNQSLNKLSARILNKIDDVLQFEDFNLVLVHGDTTTSSMVALAAFQGGIKVGHVEAGLRTYNKLAPFPEELNRQLTGRIADYHFTPTLKSKQNLRNESVSGNTVIDALFITLDKIKDGFTNASIKSLQQKINFDKKMILVTGHRRESFGVGFENICTAILEIAKNKEIEVVYPVHLNPNVQKIVYKMLLGIDNIHLINPLDYPSFVWLMSKSALIISDSGGIQEEAPSLHTPVLVTRNATEREEGIQSGFSFLVGTDTAKIVAKTTELIQVENDSIKKKNPYGDGKASEIIINFIESLNVNN